MSHPAYDRAGEVVNARETYVAIADCLQSAGSVLIGWTDGHGAHHEVLFTLQPYARGRSNLGLIGPGCLFVSILLVGAFGFDVNERHEPRHPRYVAEKLFRLSEPDETSVAVTELLNGVVAALSGDPA